VVDVLKGWLCALTLIIPLGDVVEAQTFSPHIFNGRDPVLIDGEWVMQLMPGECSAEDYGDGRGESHCTNGNVQSRLYTRNRYQEGDAVEYAFDIFVPSDFRYVETTNRERSSLEISEIQRIQTIKNHMYEMHLDSRRGLTFEERQCFGPDRFGQWNEVRIQARWSSGDDGILQVLCNGGVAYQLLGANLIPPGCGTDAKMQCRLELQDLSKPIQWEIGPMLRGYGGDYASVGFNSPFSPMPPSGITIRMRNLYEGRVRQ
jgi:hypothetical protein